LIVGTGMMKVHLYNYLFIDPKNPRKKHSIKKQIKYTLSEMAAYVAPTNIDIVSPTFWLNTMDHEIEPGETDQFGMESLLRKIMKLERFTLNFDYYNKDF
jgi:hypothetical protein